MLAPAVLQKGEGSAVVDARRKELAAQRATAGLHGAKQFYRVTVRVSHLTHQASHLRILGPLSGSQGVGRPQD